MKPIPSKKTVIDLELGAKLMAGDLKAAKEMIDAFIARLPKDKNDIVIAYQKKDHPELLYLMHQLYGATCYCGVPHLQLAAKKLHTDLTAKKNDLITEGYENVIHEIDAVLEEYKKL